MREMRSLVLCGSLVLGVAAAAGAATITIDGSGTFNDGIGALSAKADFTIQNTDQLLVTLSNTGPKDVLAPAQVLTAVFFDRTVDGKAPTSIKPLSATVTGQNGSQVVKWNGTGFVADSST